MSIRIRVMHPGEVGYSEYDVDAIEISEDVTVRAGYYGSLMILPITDARDELKDGLPK